MRGDNQEPVNRFHTCLRFTPTCVGTTATTLCLYGSGSGSPPRAWGQLAALLGLFHHARFTPTCVGTTFPLPTAKHRLPVHPHVRGDNTRRASLALWAPGSPPRAWGQLHPSCPSAGRSRFTPTCVGTTPWQTSYSAFTPVHPHVRGDNSLTLVVIIHVHGSPPRAWGQLSARPQRCLIRRFTPTCVGTTSASPWWSQSPSVHPHVRGDNTEKVVDSTAPGPEKGPRSLRSTVPYGPRYEFYSPAHYRWNRG